MYSLFQNLGKCKKKIIKHIKTLVQVMGGGLSFNLHIVNNIIKNTFVEIRYIK